MENKTCTRCGIEKPRSDFPRDRRNKNGLAAACKVCEHSRLKKAREHAKFKDEPVKIWTRECNELCEQIKMPNKLPPTEFNGILRKIHDLYNKINDVETSIFDVELSIFGDQMSIAETIIRSKLQLFLIQNKEFFATNDHISMHRSDTKISVRIPDEVSFSQKTIEEFKSTLFESSPQCL
jgi:hypothetical protein